MMKKLLQFLATLVATMGFAFAQVDVNKADQAALDSIKGIGPATSKAILEERGKAGKFKDWADFEARVKGVGDKKSMALSQAGLTVNGAKKAGTAAANAAAANAAAAPKPATAAAATAQADRNLKADTVASPAPKK